MAGGSLVAKAGGRLLEVGTANRTETRTAEAGRGRVRPAGSKMLSERMRSEMITRLGM